MQVDELHDKVFINNRKNITYANNNVYRGEAHLRLVYRDICIYFYEYYGICHLLSYNDYQMATYKNHFSKKIKDFLIKKDNI